MTWRVLFELAKTIRTVFDRRAFFARIGPNGSAANVGTVVNTVRVEKIETGGAGKRFNNGVCPTKFVSGFDGFIARRLL